MKESTRIRRRQREAGNMNFLLLLIVQDIIFFHSFLLVFSILLYRHTKLFMRIHWCWTCGREKWQQGFRKKNQYLLLLFMYGCYQPRPLLSFWPGWVGSISGKSRNLLRHP